MIERPISMPLIAVGLVLVSCMLHAIWNLLLKQARDKLAFTALYLGASSIVYLPMFLWRLPSTHIPPVGWLCIAATGIIYYGYFVGTAQAYQDGELSVVYPLMRGLGPALAVVGGVALLHERPRLESIVGISLVIVGSIIVNRQAKESVGSAPPSRGFAAGTRPALFVAIMYSLYSLVDKVGVGQLHIDPPVYLYLTYTASTFLVLPSIIRSHGKASLANEWNLNARACVAVGVLNVLSYLLVLYAMAIPHVCVSSIVPLRSMSVLISVLLGGYVLREGRLRGKISSALLMMVGVALIANGG